MGLFIRFLEEAANEILTAIVHGMRRDETSNQVRLAATRALNNSLEFTKANFDKDAERHYIMQVAYFRHMNYLSPCPSLMLATSY